MVGQSGRDREGGEIEQKFVRDLLLDAEIFERGDGGVAEADQQLARFQRRGGILAGS